MQTERWRLSEIKIKDIKCNFVLVFFLFQIEQNLANNLAQLCECFKATRSSHMRLIKGEQIRKEYQKALSVQALGMIMRYISTIVSIIVKNTNHYILNRNTYWISKINYKLFFRLSKLITINCMYVYIYICNMW